MRIYFSTRNIPALQGLPLTERMARLEMAAKRLTVPEKTFVNLLKLLVFVPLFALILNAIDNWWSLVWALVVFLCYPLIIKPIYYSLSVKYLTRVTHKDTL